MKEIQFSPTIQLNDIKHKTKKIQNFIDDGDKVKVVVKFHGRQLNFPDMGNKVLDQVLALLTNCNVEKRSTLDMSSKSIFAMISPKKKPNGKDISL